MSPPVTTSPGEDRAADSAHTVWPIPPEEGWTAEDLDRIPDLPPHTELIDGSLVFVSPQQFFHMKILRLLEYRLGLASEDDVEVVREMTVSISEKDRPEPDLMLVRVDGVTPLRQTTFPADAVVLAVEVVSPESVARDRKRKPQIYAAAGIRHFWRIELVDDEPVVYVYELDPATKSYVCTGIQHSMLKVTAPVDLEVDLTEISRL